MTRFLISAVIAILLSGCTISVSRIPTTKEPMLPPQIDIVLPSIAAPAPAKTEPIVTVRKVRCYKDTSYALEAPASPDKELYKESRDMRGYIDALEARDDFLSALINNILSQKAVCDD